MTDQINTQMKETAAEKKLRDERVEYHKSWIKSRIEAREWVNMHDKILIR